MHADVAADGEHVEQRRQRPAGRAGDEVVVVEQDHVARPLPRRRRRAARRRRAPSARRRSRAAARRPAGRPAARRRRPSRAGRARGRSASAARRRPRAGAPRASARRSARARARAAATTCRSGCRRTRGSAGRRRRSRTHTGSRPRSSTPIGTPSRARRRRQLARVELAREQPDRRRGGSDQRSAASATSSPSATAVPSSSARPSTRGSAVWKCRASIVRPRPGTSAGSDGGRLARDQRVDRVVQPQLEPRAEVVEQRRADLGPAVGGDHDVDAEAQAGGGELLDLAVEPLELALERLPAVDQQEHVGERAGVARLRSSTRGRASRNACSRSSTSVRSWRTTRVTASRSSLPAMPPTCGAPSSAFSRPPPRSMP